MPVERIRESPRLLDILDRVLDKGIVIDAWVRVSLGGIEVLTLEGRVVVASIQTYLRHVDVPGWVHVARPGGSPRLTAWRRRKGAA